MTVKDLVILLGGVVSLARKLNIYPSVVQGWISRNKIPEWRKELLKKVAKKNNIDLTDFDFFAKNKEKL